MNWDQLKRWRWAILTAAIVIAGLGFALWPEAVAVDTAKLTKGPMQVGVTDDGVTRAEEFYVVSAPVTGYLERIEFEAGDQIDQGALITRMAGRPTTPLDRRTTAELRGALSAANASVQGAKASLEQSQIDLARAEELSKRGFLAKAQLDAARTRVATDKSLLAQSQGEAARIRALLSQGGSTSNYGVAVRAPASGSILSVLNESEGVIAEGTPLVTIGDPSQIEAVIDLLSRDAVQVKPGAKVEFSQWGGDEPLVGKVKLVEPFGKLKISALGIEEQRVNVIIAFDNLSNDQAARLGHGYQVEATIVLWSENNVLRVPIGALYRGAEGAWNAFVVEDGKARQKTLKIGQINDEYGQVLSGLDEDDLVIVNPSGSLSDGTRVQSRSNSR